MAKVITKNSFTPGSAPAGLSAGELAVNVNDKKIFVGNAVGGVVTLHDQNAIVTSINGATGAVTNVARINEGNTFSVRQVFNAGFTSAGGLFSKGITFSDVSGNAILFDDPSENGLTLAHKAGFVTAAGKYFTLASEESNALVPSPASIRLAGGDNDNIPGIIEINADTIYANGTIISPTLQSPTITGALNAAGATFSGVVNINGGLTASRLNVVDRAIIGNSITVPLQSVGNTAQRMNIGVYGTISETSSAAAMIIGNAIAASKQSLQKIEKIVSDPAQFIKMRYDQGVSIHTNITGAPGTEYTDSQNTRLLVDLNGNVGINTTSPGHRLDVSGNMNVTSGATFSGIVEFNNGITAAGATFTGAVISDSGYRITSNAITSLSGTTYELLTSDNGKVITWNASSGSTLTVPSGLPVGYNTTIISLGAGLIGISGASGVTLNSFEGKLRIAGQHAAVSVISYSTNIFNIAGGLTG
jgi:hypothetical protein